jgi:hypothetical protein
LADGNNAGAAGGFVNRGVSDVVSLERSSRVRRRAAYGAVAIAVAAVMTGGAVAQTGLRGRAGPAAAELRALAAPCQASALPTLGGRWGNATAASSNGFVVGIAEDASGRSRPVLWRGGRAVALGIGLDAAMPTGVNRSGTVIGTGYDNAAEMLVGWWWSGGAVHRLPVKPGDIALPEAIDDAGRIVGALVADEEHSDGPGADEKERAAFWASTKSQPRELPAAAGDDTAHAFAIAPDGTVGGVSMGHTAAGALWDPQGRVRRLPNLDADAGLVRGFDSAARPVGDAAAASGGSRAVRWENGKPRDLGSPARGGTSSGVAATADVVAGTSAVPVQSGGDVSQAVVWISGVASVLTPLSAPGFVAVAGAATGVGTAAGAPIVVGYSADALGARRPTVWRCPR